MSSSNTVGGSASEAEAAERREIARKLGSEGGKARAAKLTREERKTIARKAAKKRHHHWSNLD